jgi:hypothetical protein
MKDCMPSKPNDSADLHNPHELTRKKLTFGGRCPAPRGARARRDALGPSSPGKSARLEYAATPYGQSERMKMVRAIQPSVGGQPDRIKCLEAIYDYAARFDGVQHWNGLEILDWYQAAQS